MAITLGYTQLNVYKQRFYDADNQSDTQDDPAIEAVITAISRAIDDICGRRFYVATETRYYTAERSDYLRIDDLISITTDRLKTDEDGDRTYEIVWATTDYDLMPLNAAVNGEPYTWLETTPKGSYSFPKGIKKGVEINGSFGYTIATPDIIREACLLGTHRIMKRQDTPLGVTANAVLGQTPLIIRTLQSDPDFMGLISPYIKRW